MHCCELAFDVGITKGENSANMERVGTVRFTPYAYNLDLA